MRKIGLVVIMMLSISAQAQTTLTYNVVIRTTSFATMWDGNDIPIYGFAPTFGGDALLPAKTLYANEGDTVILDVLNFSQGDHHTVHLHGLDVDTRNDGDPMTSFSLAHMQDTTYTFIAKHAGTYIYHCHVADVVHVQMGMYGLIVVKAANGAKTAWTGGPAFNKDYKWLMSEVDKSWHDTIPVHDMNADTVHIPPYEPNYFLVNGKSHQQIDSDDSISIHGQQNEFIYVRLCNIGFFNNRVIFPSSLDAQIIDSDGRPLPNTINNDTVDVMPGERYGVMLHPSEQIDGIVQVQYQNMNTGLTWDTQHIPVTIEGYFSIDETSSLHSLLTVHPNPVTSQAIITYNGKKNSDMHLNVYDAVGRLSMSTASLPNSNQVLLSTKALKPGLYRCVLQDDSGILASTSLTVVH